MERRIGSMDGMELMASAMHAAQARLDVSADNLANVSSAGFERHLARTSLSVNGLTTRRELDAERGSLRHTGREFDLATTSGSLFVEEGGHRVATRSGSFVLDEAGRLRDARGRLLLGAEGPLVVRPGASIDERGVVREGDEVLGRLRMTAGTVVESGFLEASNVDAVKEMVDILSAQRAFETAQKTLVALDDTRSKAVNDVVRVKS
jgi:flagellar basal-body rod protein FlgF